MLMTDIGCGARVFKRRHLTTVRKRVTYDYFRNTSPTRWPGVPA